MEDGSPPLTSHEWGIAWSRYARVLWHAQRDRPDLLASQLRLVKMNTAALERYTRLHADPKPKARRAAA